MAKGDYLYDAEVIIINPEGSGEHFTVYQVRKLLSFLAVQVVEVSEI